MAKAKFAVGDKVTFKGYSEEVAEDEQLLTEGESYEVAEVNAAEKSLAVQIDNPDFNAKKKESDANPKTIIVDVFFDEVELSADEEGEDDEEEAEEKPARGKKVAAPAKKTTAKAKAKDEEEDGEEEDADEEEAEEEAPKAKAKTKAAPAKAATKAKPAAKAKAKAAPKVKAKKEEAEEVDPYPELESEDEDIVALVNDADDLLELANELVEDQGALDYKLGGVLYHLRLGKTYQEADPSYAEKGGWGKYIDDKLSGLGYRKAMHLIDIYYNFNKFGIEAAKVQELGWTKCSKIASVMNADNAEELVELAEKSSVSDLVDTIKESYKEVGGEKGEKRRKIMFKFRLWEDQASAVEETIKAVAESMGFKDVSDAFEHIVMEWAAEHPITKKTKPAAKASAKAEAPAAKAKVKARG